MTRAKQEVKNRVGDSPAIAREIRKKNSDVKPQKTLSSLKILYYLFLSALSVVKNSCSVILNSFQNLQNTKLTIYNLKFEMNKIFIIYFCSFIFGAGARGFAFKEVKVAGGKGARSCEFRVPSCEI